MSDSNSGSEPVPIDRRSVLAAVGTAVATGLAGCGGGGGGGDGGDGGGDGNSGEDVDPTGDTGGNGQSPAGNSGGDGPGSGGGGGSGSGGGDCATMPSSYTREDVPALVGDEPVATIEVPSSGPSINSGSGGLRVEFSIGSINVQSRTSTDTTVEDELSSELPEVTDEYDLPSGARAQREEVSRTDRVDVYLPSDSDVVYVSVAASGPDDCLDGTLATVRDRMVDSIQLA